MYYIHVYTWPPLMFPKTPDSAAPKVKRSYPGSHWWLLLANALVEVVQGSAGNVGNLPTYMAIVIHARLQVNFYAGDTNATARLSEAVRNLQGDCDGFKGVIGYPGSLHMVIEYFVDANSVRFI